jgi:hypothetical protein
MARMDPPMEEDFTAGAEVQVLALEEEEEVDLTTTLLVEDSEVPAALQRFVIARLL